MADSAEHLRSAVSEVLPNLERITEEDALRDRGSGKWTRKEILGHLIDSAANNHQRFVRAQLVDHLDWPGYEQNGWVSVQKYNKRPWTDLVKLWQLYNLYLAHVMDGVPAERYMTPCLIGGENSTPVTLEWLMDDYVVHMRHHLAQIFSK